jgi:hypothetical protein
MTRDLRQPCATATGGCGQIVCHAATRGLASLAAPRGRRVSSPRCRRSWFGHAEDAAWHHLGGRADVSLETRRGSGGLEVAAADPPGGCERAHVGTVGRVALVRGRARQCRKSSPGQSPRSRAPKPSPVGSQKGEHSTASSSARIGRFSTSASAWPEHCNLPRKSPGYCLAGRMLARPTGGARPYRAPPHGAL